MNKIIIFLVVFTTVLLSGCAVSGEYTTNDDLLVFDSNNKYDVSCRGEKCYQICSIHYLNIRKKRKKTNWDITRKRWMSELFRKDDSCGHHASLSLFPV